MDMAMNTIQFQAGMSIERFMALYGEEGQCEAALELSRWPRGFACPHCGKAKHHVVWHGKVKTFECCACHRQTTLTSGTIFHASKLSLKKWFLAMYLLSQSKNNVAALELTRLVGVCYRTAWRLKHKVLEVMAEREAARRLEGRVDVDDVYFGGEHPGGKAGRGSENKVPFIAAIQTSPEGHPLYAVFSMVKTFSRDEVAAWALCHLSASCTVVSDGLACFAGVTAAGARHQPEVVGKKRKSTDMPCFKWINTIIGNLKTATSGTYHAFDFQKYGARYLGEAQYRFNRRFDLAVIFRRLLRAGVTTGKRTEAWLRTGKEWPAGYCGHPERGKVGPTSSPAFSAIF
jgi:transposase-like protein